MHKPFIVFVTGASGVGKTTLVNNLQDKYSSNTKYAFEHFDSIGVPSIEAMNEQFGSGEKWQEAMTDQWVDRLIHNYQEKDVAILEGQVNINFIKEAFQRNAFTNYEIVLIDVNEDDMLARLVNERKQPELANDDMKNWRAFLRNQAEELNIPIINTSSKSPHEVVQEFERILSQYI